VQIPVKKMTYSMQHTAKKDLTAADFQF